MKSRDVSISGRSAAISVVCQLRHVGGRLVLTSAEPLSVRTLPSRYMSEYLTVEQLINSLRATEADMKSASAHPPGAVVRLIDAAAVRELRLYEFRQESSQQDLTERNDVQEVTAEERKQAAKAARIVDQLHGRLRRETLSAEEIYRELDRSPRPDITRRLLTRDIVNDVVADDGRVVEARRGTGMIQSASETPHTIHVRVAGFPAVGSAEVAIVGIDAPGGLLGRWVGRLCTLRLPDPNSLLPMCLAFMSGFALRMVVSASIQFRADARCTDELVLTLMRIENGVDAARVAERQLRSITLGLFEEPTAAGQGPGWTC